MKQKTIALKQVLPLYIAIELAALFLTVSLILWFIPLWGEWKIKGGLSAHSFVPSFLSIETVKNINLTYYGKEYTIETAADNLAQFAQLNPFLYTQGTYDELRKISFVDGGTVVVPLNQYQIGIASWYGSYFHGRPTASTEPYDMHALTAAHKELPLGTVVRVTNLDNKKKIVVRINDRGPYVGDRVIDMSYAGARQLGYVGKGITKVLIEVLE
ncbi:MAG: rare lipoprotein A [Parcubacteria group bacterium Gr01-1014_48]|nr:MAG: rare lipoprotein A [Parcubacteria group bacterium Greene0416_14]TSC74185.1 MAG: rare lipoprotein A [Parcubacteria group bacterium Gr01-1014_48]TSD00861.1 MAG: rare lipoprotein A [Parcubacteria group bacterium Greene1014_15]TSD07943.1 MAG: rare lipoprotein A [Parcubacteria group bacterium Greene0714_4]